MKASVGSAALFSAILANAAPAKEVNARDVDTRFPYTGPAVPVADWVDPDPNGNGKGFIRLVEPPAVKPKNSKPTNNINVISTAFVPGGITVHYQTPFGLGEAPAVKYGPKKNDLCYTAQGASITYGRTPSCSAIKDVTQCSEFFHNVQLTNLEAGTTYYYQIPGANGTTSSEVMSFKTARSTTDHSALTIAILNDMGYTNAQGTYKQLNNAVDNDGVEFAWHGGDISYADDWFDGILPCEADWDVCYNGTSTRLPNTPPAPFPKEYDTPLPAGEVPNQGSPQGGDMSMVYESNWDAWQNWMNSVTKKVPYMVNPGNHEAACAEFDGELNQLTAYLDNDQANSTANASTLSYYSCPPSQRNFTAYQFRFRMPGEESGGVGNFWYSFDYGLAHFVSVDGETDYPYSPEWPFARDVTGNETLPAENETFITDSGPFGTIEGDQWKVKTAYQQYQWLKKDLESVNRTKTPWVIAMSHRPMYSSEVSSYQAHLRNAFEELMLENGVDVYYSGHIHWYERIWPIGNSTIDRSSILSNNTYQTNPGVSMTHIINGMAGNIESHSTINASEILNITAVLNQYNYGFSKLTFHNATTLTSQYIKGIDGSVGDEVTVVKKGSTAASGYGH
ncbi:Acid phosphatase [Friedmanniomyces simplex]|uniref:Purple acid phosphatase n=1 Tax=Friedmanniomyces simplex TaxID=329884 RepID=A0A4U0WR80_9PEZI|nr:Acid phosphatase [Friedmanniomyces simplex]